MMTKKYTSKISKDKRGLFIILPAGLVKDCKLEENDEITVTIEDS
jgi:hypothetical protein